MEKVKWENILSPKEMEDNFGSNYSVVRKGKKIYINSDFLVEIVLMNKPKNAAQIIENIPKAYSYIMDRLIKIEYEKEYPDNYPFPKREPFKLPCNL